MLDGKTGGDGGAPSLTGPLGGPQLAQAGTGDEPIGVIRAISGQVGLTQISSTPGEIGVGSPVHLNDTVSTGPGGAIEILFVDGTSFSLGPDARVQIDKLIYNPDGGGNGLDISVATGAFAFIAGSIAEAPGEGMSIETPAGTIGIRGTAGAGTPDPAGGGYLVSVFQGHITVTTLAGVVLLDEPLETTHLSSRFAPPSEPSPLTPDAAQELFGGALQLLRGRQQDLHERPEEEFAQLGNINPAAGAGSDAPVEAAEPLPVQLQLADIYGLLRLLVELGALPPGALENSSLNFPEFSNDALGTPGFQALAFANTPPMATDDTPDPNDGGPLAGLSTGEDTSLTIPADRLLANDSDPDGDTLTITSVSDPPHGTAVLNPDGSITYTPDANYNGTDSFTYTVSDGQGGSSTATVTVEIAAVNDPPVAHNDSADPAGTPGTGLTTSEDSALTIAATTLLANDSDADGDGLTITAVGDPAHGTAVLNADGSITYTPDANYNGADSFTYTVSDGQGGTATATATVNVQSINDLPVAGNDSASTDEDTPVTITVLGNDSDADGDALTVSQASAENGSVTINPDGTLSYTPNPNFNGADTITYTISDGNGGTATATVAVAVNAVNDDPVAVDDSASTDEDTPVVIDVLKNDTDVDGDELTVTQATAEHGTVTLNDDGTLAYTPDENFNGTDTITYTVSDGEKTDTGTATVTVASVNDPPVAVDDKASTNEDTPVIIDVLANDTDVEGDELTVTQATAEHGTVEVNDDGTLTYTPDENFNGTDTITYTVSDGKDGTDTGKATVTVASVNDPPVAVDDSASTKEDTSVVIDVLDNDTDADGDKLTVTQATAEHGTVTFNDDGTLTYTPDENFNGTDTITYTVSDGNGGTDTGVATVTVASVNDPPVAGNDSASTSEDTPVVIDVLDNDTDADSDNLKAVIVDGPDHGTLTANADGTFTYTPDANYNGPDSFTYQANDGKADSGVATVSIDVTSVNDQPSTMGDEVSTPEDTALTIPAATLLANDSDPDNDTLTITEVSDAPHGTVALNADGSVTYTPDANYNGSDSFTYTVSDGKGGTSTATVNVTVTPVNDAPVARNDSYTVAEDGTLTVAAAAGVLANDSDVEGDPLNAVVVDGPDHGELTLNADGSFTYTPDANYNGPDSFTYKANDGTANSGVATVSLNVTSANDPPVAGDDKVTTREDTALTIAAGTLLANDSDVDGDALKITSVSDSPHGTVVLNENGSVTYTPDKDFHGTDSFTYTVSDGNGGTDTATVAVTVEDSTPKPGHDTATVFESGLAAGSRPADNTETATGTLTLGDPDSPLVSEITFAGQSYTDKGDGDADGFITVASTAGLLKVNTASGEYTYTLTNPTQGDVAQESFGYTVTDEFGNSANGSLTVGITDDAPTATSDTFSTADTVDQKVNLVIVLDISGSMSQDPDVAGFDTRLALAKAALADLFAAYESTTDINVLIVPFSSQSNTSSGWLSTGEDANAYLDTLSAGGGTNYAAGIQRTMDVFATGLPTADKTQVYFLSDGVPTQGQSLRAAGLVGTWEQFVADRHIEDVFAVGIGSGIPTNDQDLADVALPNGSPEPNLIIVTDESRLTETLVDTVPSTVSGNILTNDIFGADGRGNGGVGLVSITVDDITYTYNQATNQITNDGGRPTLNGAVLTVTTALEGTLELNFTNGAFKYVAPDLDDTASASEKFAYTIVDGDGDVATSTLTVNITDASGGSSQQSLALAMDRGAEPTARSETVSLESSGGAEVGSDRLHGGGRMHGLNARDIFAGNHELDLSTLGHGGPHSPGAGHAPAGHDLHALGDRHALDTAPPPAATVSPADVDFHHTSG